MAELGKVVLELDEASVERLACLFDEKIAPLLSRIESLEWALDSAQEDHYRDITNLEADLNEIRYNLDGK